MTDREWKTYFEDYATRRGLGEIDVDRLRAGDGYNLAYVQWKHGATSATVDGILDDAARETKAEAGR